MQKKVLKIKQDLDGNTIVADESDEKKHIQHIEEYIQTAGVILSNGSVYAESVTGTVVGNFADVTNLPGTFGSVLGVNNGWPPFATPLQVASREGHIEITRLLLSAGANINNLNGYTGRTPIMWAAINGHAAVIQLLLDRGADSKIKIKTGSALDLAKSKGHSEAVKVLKAVRTGLFKSW